MVEGYSPEELEERADKVHLVARKRSGRPWEDVD